MSVFTIEAYVVDEVGPVIYLCAGCYSFVDARFEPFKNIAKTHWIPLSEAQIDGERQRHSKEISKTGN